MHSLAAAQPSSSNTTVIEHVGEAANKRALPEWLALLPVRFAETESGETWVRIREKLDGLALVCHQTVTISL